MELKTEFGDFKEELWNTVMGFGEPVLIGTVLDEKARGELLEKMVRLREQKQSAEDKSYKDSSTPIEKTEKREQGLKLMIRVKLIISLKILKFFRLEKGEARVG